MNKTAGARIFKQGELSLSIPVPGWVPYLIRRLHRASFVYLFLLLALTARLANAQSNTGDLRLKVTDPSGSPVRATVRAGQVTTWRAGPRVRSGYRFCRR